MNYSEIIESEKKVIKRDLWLLAIGGLVAMAIVWLSLNISSEKQLPIDIETKKSTQEAR